MEFRNSCLQDDQNMQFLVFNHLTDFVNQTLCPKGDAEFHNKECLHRECQKYGVEGKYFMSQELDTSVEAKVVKWQTFQYIDTGRTSEMAKK